MDSPSLSISDLYDVDSQPITIPAPQPKRSNSVMANALAVPGAIKDLLYPSHQDLDSSDEDNPSVGWLHEKKRSGMKLVYGLLGTSVGSPSTAFDEDEDDEEDDKGSRADDAESLDDRTMTNFYKYFVLPESEKLLTGEKRAVFYMY